MTSGNDDSRVVSIRGTKLLRKSLKIVTIMRKERLTLTNGVRKLGNVVCTKLARVSRGNSYKSARTDQIRHQHVHIFVEVQLDEKVFHGYFTNGSIKSSEMRLRSMWILISSW